MIVVDTGLIVAMANRRDQDHERCTKLLATYDGPLLLPEPLLTEVGYMLSTRAGTLPPKIKEGLDEKPRLKLYQAQDRTTEAARVQQQLAALDEHPEPTEH